MTEARDSVAQAFIQALPHCQALGMRLDQIGSGFAVISMPYDPALIGDPVTGVIHGGAVSALMDTCGGAAVMSHPDRPLSTATISLRIDYLRPARPGHPIVARAECHHMTRTVAFIRAVANDGGAEPVALATGTFTVERGSAS